MRKPCSVSQCSRFQLAFGLCRKHYDRARHNRPLERETKMCSGPDCSHKVYCKNLCRAHYRQSRRGNALRPAIHNLHYTERFEHYIHHGSTEEDCWIWLGTRNPEGYGLFGHDNKQHLAHRVSYELQHDVELYPDEILDHLCNVRHCVNPKHLEKVSLSINTTRGLAMQALRAENARLRRMLLARGVDLT